KTGEPLFRIVDLSELWLTLEAYESDLIWLRYGQQVTFTVEAFPGETFQGQIAFIAPEVDTQTRSVSIRVNVPNQEGRLKPGMFAKGVVEVKMGAGGVVYAPELAGKWISPMHPEVVKDGPGQCDVCGMDLVPAESLGYVELTEPMAPLIIPASAALRTGKRAVVYVEKPDMDQPTYEGREVVLGPRAGDMFIVESGLDEGERVVTKGAFKIDSALQIQAKPSMMNPEHENPKATEPVPLNESPRLMEAYLALQAALAADDLDTAKDAVTAMMDIAGHAGALPKLLHKMMAAETLDELRKPHFELLSNAMITEAKAHPESFNGPLFLMHCPMVYRDRGADWLQRNKPLQNPYFGASMLHCGEVQETIGESSSGGDGHDH
ncbi:MAG: efflux RND transporter periplasmic adaptor subunit, partial [Verrucomicrobiae bacterium]|nr:efflux RND transporter periplasmic adaptor subunit [Verrucomicrobiae bacterium]